jgi:hypothetical protein
VRCDSSSKRRFTCTLAGVFAVCGFGGAARAATSYSFTFDPAASGIDATIALPVATSGTLIGAYDPNSNPTGTRTKPGIFGSFGDTENVAINVDLSSNLGGDVHTHPTGTFELALDPAAGTVTMTGLTANLLGGTPVVLPVSVTFQTPSFRTRNPSSIYPGGVPITLPVGNATLSQLDIAQTGEPALGALTATAPDQYSFLVAPAVSLTATLDFFGNELTPPPSPAAFPLEGQIVVMGPTARLTSLRQVDLSNTQNPGTTMPQFPLDLPTVLPPNDTAHVLMNLTLNEVSFSVSGTSTLAADGVSTAPPICPGDTNCDGLITFADVDWFVEALSGESTWSHGPCPWRSADCSGDGNVTFADVDPFVALLGTTCP